LNNHRTLKKNTAEEDLAAKEYSTKDYVNSDEEVKGETKIYVKRQKSGSAKKTSFKKDSSLKGSDEEEALD